MATDATILLERLTCRRESDGTGHSEPYIWPVLLWVDDDTLKTPELVGVVSVTLDSERIELADGIKPGQSAGIPASVGAHRIRFRDNLNTHVMMLAVALWESDETPEAAMRAGFSAFQKELRAAVAANLLRLNGAKDNNQELKVIIGEISTRVRKAVETAIEGALTFGQKISIAFRRLNLDDIVGSDFVFISDLVAKPIRMTFLDEDNEYVIDGQFQVKRVAIDVCQAQVDAAKAAQTAVNDVENQIRALQAELQHAPPGEKPFINAQIKSLRENDLRAAQTELDNANRALRTCRDRFKLMADEGAVVAGTLTH